MQMGPNTNPEPQAGAGPIPEATIPPPDRANQPGTEDMATGIGTGKEVPFSGLGTSNAELPTTRLPETVVPEAPPTESPLPQSIPKQPAPLDMPVVPETSPAESLPPATVEGATPPAGETHTEADTAQEATKGDLGAELDAAGLSPMGGQGKTSPVPPAGLPVPQEVTASGATSPTGVETQPSSPIPPDVIEGAVEGKIKPFEAWRSPEVGRLVEGVGSANERLQSLEGVAQTQLSEIIGLRKEMNQVYEELRRRVMGEGQDTDAGQNPERSQEAA